MYQLQFSLIDNQITSPIIPSHYYKIDIFEKGLRGNTTIMQHESNSYI